MSDKKLLPIVRRIILKHKVRKFALDEIKVNLELEFFITAKAIYWAAVHGCAESTIVNLVKQDTVGYVTDWAEAREALSEVRGL